jgi:hypothetical protein
LGREKERCDWMDEKERLTENYNLVWSIIKFAILTITLYSLATFNFSFTFLFPAIAWFMLLFGTLSVFAYAMDRKKTYPSFLRTALLIFSTSLLLAGCRLLAEKALDANGVLTLGGILIGWGLCLCVEWEVNGGW